MARCTGKTKAGTRCERQAIRGTRRCAQHPTVPTPKKARAREAKDWAPAFLTALEDTHLVTESAKRAGIHRDTAYDRRSKDEAFARAWGDVEERSTEIHEQIAVKRAAAGSDLLLMFLLKARRPDVYREHHHVQHAGDVEVNLSLVTDPDLRDRAADLRARLAAARPVKPGRPDAGNGAHLAAAAPR